MHHKLQQLMPYLLQDDQFPEIYATPEDRIIMAHITLPDTGEGEMPFVARVAQVEFHDDEGPVVVIEADTDGYDIDVERDGLDNVRFVIHEVVYIIG